MKAHAQNVLVVAVAIGQTCSFKFNRHRLCGGSWSMKQTAFNALSTFDGFRGRSLEAEFFYERFCVIVESYFANVRLTQC